MSSGPPASLPPKGWVLKYALPFPAKPRFFKVREVTTEIKDQDDEQSLMIE